MHRLRTYIANDKKDHLLSFQALPNGDILRNIEPGYPVIYDA